MQLQKILFIFKVLNFITVFLLMPELAEQERSSAEFLQV